MKEATGELNMTVITVVAIAAVGTLFTLFVWPNIQSNIILSTACGSIDANGNYETEDGKKSGENGYVKCEKGECTADYNGKKYKRTCNQEANN
jgi:hypothetical protein